MQIHLCDPDRGVLNREGVSHVTERRQLLLGTASAALLAASAGETAAAGFPDYRYRRLALVKSKLRYNPTGELIFPTIRGTKGRISGTLAAYYLYYAPHAMWNDDAKRMYLYFHGENTVTRLASSTDGVHLSYQKEVLSTRLLPAGTTETSYARVFRHDLPSRGARYVMVFMLNNTTNRRDIGWGWSQPPRRLPRLVVRSAGQRQVGRAFLRHAPGPGAHDLRGGGPAGGQHRHRASACVLVVRSPRSSRRRSSGDASVVIARSVRSRRTST